MSDAIWQQQTEAVTWHLPAGVDPQVAPFEEWFPQTLADPAGCGWAQYDTYDVSTPVARETVDDLLVGGVLDLDASGVPADAFVVQEAFFVNECELASTGPADLLGLTLAAVLAAALGGTLKAASKRWPR